MSGALLLAIDCGTGSARAILFEEDGTVAGLGQHEWSHRPEPGVPGSQRFDTTASWSLVCACVHEALAAAGAGAAARIAGVSATSMREGMVLSDAGGRELWACPNVDGRAGAEAAELVAGGLAEEIYARAGDWVAITAPARLLWLARHEPETLAATAHVGMLGDWVVQRLSGAWTTDASLGSSSALFDLAQRTWSDELIAHFGIARSAFPEVVPAGTVVGGVTAAAAADTGLIAGTPVVVGGADTQLGLLGAGIGEPGRVTVVGGSFWQQTALVDQPLIDPQRRLRTLCHVLPDRWMIEGIGFYSGIAMRWFRDAFCGDVVARAARERRDPYALLEREAQAVPPGANGLFAIVSNLMDAKRWIHAAPSFVGFDVDAPERSGRAACFRALEEAAAYVSRGHVGIVEEVTGTTVTEVAFTGGAANGELWPQIVADVLGVPLHIPSVRESSALGAAICAGLGTGVYDDPGVGAQLVRTERVVEPDPEAAAAYADLYERWRTVYAAALELTETGAVRPLWRAAGT